MSRVLFEEATVKTVVFWDNAV